VPAKSKSQKNFMHLVEAFKKGKNPNASKAARDAASGMSISEVRDFTKTKTTGLLKKASDEDDSNLLERVLYNSGLPLGAALGAKGYLGLLQPLLNADQDPPSLMDKLEALVHKDKGILAPSKAPMFQHRNIVPKALREGWPADREGIIGMGPDPKKFGAPILAHEYGHLKQFKKLPKFMLGAPLLSNLGIGIGSSVLPFIYDEDTRKNVAIGATLSSLPNLGLEFDASRRGVKVLKSLGTKGMRRYLPWVGVPTYMAQAAIPGLAYLLDNKLREPESDMNFHKTATRGKNRLLLKHAFVGALPVLGKGLNWAGRAAKWTGAATLPWIADSLAYNAVDSLARNTANAISGPLYAGPGDLSPEEWRNRKIDVQKIISNYRR